MFIRSTNICFSYIHIQIMTDFAEEEIHALENVLKDKVSLTPSFPFFGVRVPLRSFSPLTKYSLNIAELLRVF